MEKDILMEENTNEVVEVVEVLDESEVKEVKEAAVPADFGIEEEQVEETKARPQSKFIDTTFGIKSKEVIENEEKYRLEANFKELVSYKRNNTLLWVRVASSELTEDGKNVCATTVWNDIRIVIPDTLYFMSDFEFEEGYEDLDELEKARARQKALSYQIGAKICIMIESLKREENVLGDVKYGVVGNRVKAMNLLQFYYFTRPNLREDEVVNVGDTVKANVLSVSPVGAVVESLGVESRLDRFNLAFETVRDCREHVKPGDEILVRIKKLHINKEEDNYKRVYMTVSARVRSNKDVNDLVKANSVYQGTVSNYNPDKKIYTVVLGNGVNVSVHRSNNDYSFVRVGDKVSVRVVKVEKTYALGRILSVVSAD